MSDGNGLAEVMLGLDGLRILEVVETPDELMITVETTATVVGCRRCGSRAEAHDRRLVEIRDLSCFGRPVRLGVLKRRWRCVEPDCDARTWTESHPGLPSRAVMTHRASFEAARQVGELARPVSGVASEFGVCWDTIMTAVITHGTPLVTNPDRVGVVESLGVDETSFLKANRTYRTVYATGLVDTDAGILIDMVEGNTASDLRNWCQRQDGDWLAGIATVSIDLTDSYRSGLSPHLDHTIRVADPFHVVRVGNRCLDKVRRRVQNETKGHRRRTDDPLYRIRKLLLTGNERLDEQGQNRMLLGLRVGDPYDEVAGAWLAKESVRDIYLVDDPADAAENSDPAFRLFEVVAFDDLVDEVVSERAHDPVLRDAGRRGTIVGDDRIASHVCVTVGTADIALRPGDPSRGWNADDACRFRHCARRNYEPQPVRGPDHIISFRHLPQLYEPPLTQLRDPTLSLSMAPPFRQPFRVVCSAIGPGSPSHIHTTGGPETTVNNPNDRRQKCLLRLGFGRFFPGQRAPQNG